MRFVLLLILLLGIVNIQSLPFFDPNRINIVRTMPYYVARVVDVPIVNEEKRYGSKWDAWNDIISPESGIEFAWKGVTFYIEEDLSIHKLKGSKRSMINQFRDMSNNYNRMRGLISKELGNGNNVVDYNDDSVDKRFVREAPSNCPCNLI